MRICCAISKSASGRHHANQKQKITNSIVGRFDRRPRDPDRHPQIQDSREDENRRQNIAQLLNHCAVSRGKFWVHRYIPASYRSCHIGAATHSAFRSPYSGTESRFRNETPARRGLQAFGSIRDQGINHCFQRLFTGAAGRCR